MLDAAQQAAQDALLYEVHVQLKPTAYTAFVAHLVAPPQANERLRKTLQTRPILF